MALSIQWPSRRNNRFADRSTSDLKPDRIYADFRIIDNNIGFTPSSDNIAQVEVTLGAIVNNRSSHRDVS